MDGFGIRIEGLRKRYGEGDTAVDALKEVNMTVAPGEVVAGPRAAATAGHHGPDALQRQVRGRTTLRHGRRSPKWAARVAGCRKRGSHVSTHLINGMP